ncbi:MAG: glycoside hydrolase family 1 protein [Candidatus Kerfeldbacteria bacterium]|nr:glycoside hydrolase family 1 protein [Candidatus Kerfeldbacteria bacterium]
MEQTLRFPEGFLWGASTSSHQVEGGQNNDWSAWERLGKVAGGQTSGLACDHWNLFRSDFELAKRLGHTVHRFSIEWSRVEPAEGQWDEAAIGHYQTVARELHQRGIEPFVTLWHFTSPPWLMERGGWESPETVKLFARFARKMAVAMPDARYWMTINEANVYAILSYLIGVWPPEVTSSRRAWRVYRNLIAGHRAAALAVKHNRPDALVGSAHNVIAFEPKRPESSLDRLASRLAATWYNDHWFKQVASTSDFIGLNHYTRQWVKFESLRRPIVPEFGGPHQTDFGWDMYPTGIYRALKSAGRFGRPIYITENGLADHRDQWRQQFIRDYLLEVHRAVTDGVDVRGYLHWSLLDNFEWREGYSKRFGLIEVDFSTQQRTVRPSAEYYAAICRSNSLTVDDHA